MTELSISINLQNSEDTYTMTIWFGFKYCGIKGTFKQSSNRSALAKISLHKHTYAGCKDDMALSQISLFC